MEEILIEKKVSEVSGENVLKCNHSNVSFPCVLKVLYCGKMYFYQYFRIILNGKCSSNTMLHFTTTGNVKA